MPFQKYGYKNQFKGVLIDANLLLLVLVGLFNKTLIGKFKRTLKYDEADFKNLLNIILLCKGRIYTTPNILTEISNLTDNETLNKNNGFYKFLYAFIDEFVETLYSSKVIMKNNETAFIKLGLTDASIINLAANDILIVTEDLPLYHFLISNSKPVLNYNHLKFR